MGDTEQLRSRSFLTLADAEKVRVAARAAGPGRSVSETDAGGHGSNDTASARWIGANDETMVGGVLLRGPFAYVGSGLTVRAPTGGIEPALIDPRLAVGQSPDWSGWARPVRVSYASLSPAQRRAYLGWLSGARGDRVAEMVFRRLWFFGLERRLLVDVTDDDTVWDEAPVLLARLEHVVGVCGEDHEFRRRAENLVVAVTSLFGPKVTGYQAPLMVHHLVMPPLWVVIPLARRLRAGGRLDAVAALRLVHQHPRVFLGVVGERCRDDFDRLFVARFEATYPDGADVRVSSHREELFYEAWSPGFGQVPFLQVEVPVPSMRDVTLRLGDLIESCREALHPFCRALGRDPGIRDTLVGLALLPGELLRREPATISLVEWLRACIVQDASLVDVSEVLRRLGVPVTDRVTKGDATRLACVLEHLGFGFEPDPRFGPDWAASAEPMAVFALNEPQRSSEALRCAYAMAQLLMVVRCDTATRADVVVDVVDRCRLADGDRRRLDGFVRWIGVASRGTRRLGARVRALSDTSRGELVEVVLREVVEGPGGDARLGDVSEVLAACDVDVSVLIDALHARRCGTDSEAILVDQPAPSPGFAIPPRPVPAVMLDPTKVAQLAHGHEVSARWLGGLLDCDEAPVATEPVRTGSEPDLSGPLRDFATRLAERAVWPAAEFATVAGECGLMVEGAREALNDRALHRLEGLVCEGDDPVEIDGVVLEELLDA